MRKLSETDIATIVSAARYPSDVRCDSEGKNSLFEWDNQLDALVRHIGAKDALPGRIWPWTYGAQYGAGLLKKHKTIASVISPQAADRLRHALERELRMTTAPTITVVRNARDSAAKCLQGNSSSDAECGAEDSCFLLLQAFKQFPVLGRLWVELIHDWYSRIVELTERFAADRGALSRCFFNDVDLGEILDVVPNLSDPHNNGRRVMMLRLDPGLIIYKPRSGQGEWDWQHVLEFMNSQGFEPSLRTVKVMRRDGYCWMQHVPHRQCDSRREIVEFHERLGGLIAAACQLRLVDCHRDNLIASGADPVLVDVETIGYRDEKSPRGNSGAVLSRSGFISAGTGVFDGRSHGKHAPKIKDETVRPCDYKSATVQGFEQGIKTLVGSRGRCQRFDDLLRSLENGELRWIYWSTENYDRVRRSSVQPVYLRSGVKRETFIRKHCTVTGVPPDIIDGEVQALLRLDIPHFKRKRARLNRLPALSVRRNAKVLRDHLLK